MKIRVFVLACGFGVAGATGAQARLQPTPPPSGIVVHLFGPDSVLQDVAPALANAPGALVPGPRAAGPGPAGHGPAGPGAVSAGPSGAEAEPTWGNVLHQMFVTGDPNAPNQPARGKTGHQLAD